MLTNTAVIKVGRLLEIRIDASFRSVEDVDRLFDALEGEVAKLPPSVRTAAVADWRRCPVMPSAASDRLVQRLLRLRPRTERSAILVSGGSPTAALQLVRLIRQAGHPDRRPFTEAHELFRWMEEILTLAEVTRLRQFLGENEARG